MIEQVPCALAENVPSSYQGDIVILSCTDSSHRIQREAMKTTFDNEIYK